LYSVYNDAVRWSNCSRPFAILGAMFVAFLVGAPFAGRAAGPSIYVAYGGDLVGQFNTTTGAAVFNPLNTGQAGLVGLALVSSTLYEFSGTTSVLGVYSAIGGVNSTNFLLAGTSAPDAMALTVSFTYVANKGDGSVNKYSTATGVEFQPPFITGQDSPSALAVSDGILYVANQGSGTVSAYFAATGAPYNTTLITGLSSPSALAVSGGILYVASAGTGTVGAYFALTGAPLNSSLITGLVSPSALAVQGGNLFVASKSTGAVGKYIATTGVALNRAFISGVANVSALVASPQPPVVTSVLTAAARAGIEFGYQITASNDPASFGASGLPAGLRVNASTGLISGIPETSGTFLPVISASNLSGSGSARLRLIVAVPLKPVVISARRAKGIIGEPFTYRIRATNLPTSYGATGLPPGLSVDAGAGLISGTPTATGTYVGTMSASNATGTGSASLTVVVNFDFALARGTYRGMLSAGGGNAGLVSLTLGSNGSFTGYLLFADARYALDGAFSPDGTYDKVLKVGSSALDANLSLSSAPPGLSGSVAGIESYTVAASPIGTFNAVTLPHGLAGRYTAVIPPISGTDPALPHAPGYATMTVSARGGIRLAGKLADGVPFTAGSQLGADGRTWTLFAPLYAGKNKGSIAGAMSFESLSNSDSDGPLTWINPGIAGGDYPDPFSVGVSLLAAKYAAPPLAPGAAAVTLQGGNLPPPGLTDSLMISPADHVTSLGPNDVTLSLSPGSGLFTGKFQLPLSGRKTAFGGVIYMEPVPSGFGQFSGTSEAGSVQLSQ
jgi:hypothetical protein